MAPDQSPPRPPTALELRAIAARSVLSRRDLKVDERERRRTELAARLPAFLAAPLPGGVLVQIASLLHRAAGSGLMRADLFRFPCEFCSDNGRAINNGEADWPVTLQGLAHRYFALLAVEFHPLGYRVGAEIVSWPAQMPGDIALFLAWHDEGRT